VDADTFAQPELLAASFGAAQAHGAALFSCSPVGRWARFGKKTVMRWCSAR
jgi:hypothetical protein